MTPEQRLNQIESILETAARYINRHEEAFERHEQAFANLELQQQQINERMIGLIDLFSELAAISRQNQEDMRQNREYMRQNREEIRRIWEYLLSQSGNGHSGSN